MIRSIMIIRCVALLLLAVLPVMVTTSLMAGQSKPVSGFRAEYLIQIDDVQKKLVDLANAFPAEKYVWRPGEGVRSVSEVFVHISSTNFLIPTLTGVKAPEGLNGDMEKTVTEKGKVIAMVKRSFEHLRKAITGLTDKRLDEMVKMYGRQTSVRDVYFTAATHIHEHLGQLIAYARMNSIVPPWTAERQAQQPKENK